jgi:hypothetical protein
MTKPRKEKMELKVCQRAGQLEYTQFSFRMKDCVLDVEIKN